MILAIDHEYLRLADQRPASCFYVQMYEDGMDLPQENENATSMKIVIWLMPGC